MWEVVNRTPFAAQGYFVRDKIGVEHWCLAIRAGFDVRLDGLVDISADQKPVRLAPVYTDGTTDELTEETDFVPFRPRADILVAGTATAIDGRTFTSQPVGINVGSLNKSALAVCPRRIARRAGRWDIIDQAATASVPLSWRHSLGGTDPFAPDDASTVCEANPVGKGWSLHLGNAPDGAEIDIPQIENPNTPFHPDRTMPEPVGFGPIQPAWSPRVAHAGTYDDDWLKQRAPLPPLDFSEAFHQAAPTDQIYPGELRGGEPVSVEGLHPDGPYAFRLPQSILEARTWIGWRSVTHRFRIVSITVDATARRLDMTWNTCIPCPEGDHLVDRSLVTMPQIAGVAR